MPHHVLALRLGHLEDAVPELAADAVGVGILRQAEPPQEGAALPLGAVSLLVLILLLLHPRAAYLQDLTLLHLHLQVLFLHPCHGDGPTTRSACTKGTSRIGTRETPTHTPQSRTL